MELDVVAVVGGKLVVAECKDPAKDLHLDDALKLASIADHLGCSRLIFATPNSFLQADDFFLAVEEECKARVEWWEGDDIFDGHPYRLTLEEQPPEEESKAYLGWLVNHLKTKLETV